ncbi:hypothetical protein [Streptomyces pacificus]|uniref:Uncharacterized protein n=1 Tax=Streptomyces pacificus TaxID=2705029 RepID=A0A6A0AUL3_9ACTN|nr:hypothetical protein [Streptomyces pacificus]GFH36602.1 hypothetical protein SCWH03_28330 [Streptomyces pacificus]
MIPAFTALMWLACLGLLVILGAAGCALVLARRDRRDTARAARPHSARVGTAEQDAAAIDRPFLEIAAYRHDHGHRAWAWRCWGDGTCDGRLSLDHASEDGARRAACRHLTETHGAPDA